MIDSRQVWIVAHVPEFDLSAIDGTPGALVELAAYPSRRFDILGSLGGQLINIGHVLDPETRTILIRYEVPNPDGVFRIGMFADVHIETAVSLGAVAVPDEAIVMDNGRPIAFVLLSGETFQKRDLVLGIRDGRYVEVKQGIAEGERVVTKGAYLVKLASSSPASFGEGHVH